MGTETLYPVSLRSLTNPFDRPEDQIRYNRYSRGVAQPGSAPALGAGGRRFKSYRPDQFHFSNLQAARFALKWRTRGERPNQSNKLSTNSAAFGRFTPEMSPAPRIAGRQTPILAGVKSSAAIPGNGYVKCPAASWVCRPAL